jgi:hypothetical protein
MLYNLYILDHLWQFFFQFDLYADRLIRDSEYTVMKILKREHRQICIERQFLIS